MSNQAVDIALTSTAASVSVGQQQSVFITSTEFSHQTFQSWIDSLVDMNSSEELKLKSIQELSLNLEVNSVPFYSFKPLQI